jgi:hypothetical protein
MVLDLILLSCCDRIFEERFHQAAIGVEQLEFGPGVLRRNKAEGRVTYIVPPES